MAEELIDAVAADGHMEFMQAYAFRLPMLVLARVTGMSPAQAQMT